MDRRYASYIGALSVILFLSSWAVGALVDGEWTWRENMVCALGESGSQFVRSLFVGSCIVSGVGLTVSGFILQKGDASRTSRAGFLLSMLCGLLLLGVGTTKISTGIHDMFAISLSTVAGLSMCSFALGDLLFHKYLTFGAMAITGLVILLSFVFLGPRVQTISIVGLLSWLLIRYVMVLYDVDDPVPANDDLVVS